MNILQACDDPNLFGPWFVKNHSNWTAWRAFLAALFGLPMSPEELLIYRECTGRLEPPGGLCRESYQVVGRRGGKSCTLALIAAYLACFRDYRPYLAPGERGYIVIVAADRKQCRSIMGYLQALLHGVKLLVPLIRQFNSEAIELANRVTIEVATCSYRTIRGRTIVAALLDELAFWHDDTSANPDSEVLAAIKPSMATIPDAMLLCASSPYARRGVLWQTYDRWFGKEGGPLVWRAPTRRMNPSVPQAFIDGEIARDPAAAAAEYEANFRTDVESFLSREVVTACVEDGIVERRPERTRRYCAFTDPSGGSSDSMTLAVAHRSMDTAVLDLVRERKAPFSPEAVVEEFVDVLRRYRISRVIGDRYAGEWPREQFAKRGIHYVEAEKTKSEIYLDALPLFNSRAVDLLDNPSLVNQLVGLERRVVRGGRETIDHMPGAHDDVANAVCGALVCLPSAPRVNNDWRSVVHEGVNQFKVHSAYHGELR